MSRDIRKKDILDMQDKGIAEAENIQTRLFRKILWDLDIHPYKWAHLLSRYLNDPRNGYTTKAARDSRRGNLNKELRKPRLTFGTVMEGIKLLGPLRMRLIAEFDWESGKTTQHMVTQNIRRPSATNIPKTSESSDPTATPPVEGVSSEVDEILKY